MAFSQGNAHRPCGSTLYQSEKCFSPEDEGAARSVACWKRQHEGLPNLRKNQNQPASTFTASAGRTTEAGSGLLSEGPAEATASALTEDTHARMRSAP